MSEIKYDFQARIPVDEVMELVKLVRSGNLILQKGHALQHVGCISGELGAFLAQYDDPQPIGSTPYSQMSLEEVLRELEDLTPEDNESVKATSPGTYGFGLNWVALTITFLKFVVDQLQ